ncbi:hypothetical protein Tco_1023500 [Tanacetum coccineum]
MRKKLNIALRSGPIDRVGAGGDLVIEEGQLIEKELSNTPAVITRKACLLVIIWQRSYQKPFYQLLFAGYVLIITWMMALAPFIKDTMKFEYLYHSSGAMHILFGSFSTWVSPREQARFCYVNVALVWALPTVTCKDDSEWVESDFRFKKLYTYT